MYAEDKKINEFISSKIDKFEFSKGGQAPEDTTLLWIYNNIYNSISLFLYILSLSARVKRKLVFERLRRIDN